MMRRRWLRFCLSTLIWTLVAVCLYCVAGFVVVKYFRPPYRNVVLVHYTREAEAEVRVCDSEGQLIGIATLGGMGTFDSVDYPEEEKYRGQYYAFEWQKRLPGESDLSVTLSPVIDDYRTGPGTEFKVPIAGAGPRMHVLVVIRIDEDGIRGGAANCSLAFE